MQTSNSNMNHSLQAMGGACKDYWACTKAWNDGQRGVLNGALSNWGSNCTDVVFKAKDGGDLTIVRPPNYDEKLGIAPASKLYVMDSAGNRITLQAMLKDATKHASYMLGGVEANIAEDEKVVFRVQTTWVPLAKGQTKRELAPQFYCYQAKDPDDPRNAVFVGTAQGLHAHADRPGPYKLMAHSQGADGAVREHWFEAEPSEAMVGHAQYDDAPRDAKKAKAVEIGIEGMGPRANCFVVVSVPNRQKPTPWRSPSTPDSVGPPVYRSLGSTGGVSHAARVSVAEAVAGEKRKRGDVKVERPTTGTPEPIVVTIMLYNTVQLPEGQPATTSVDVLPEDMALAVKDMEHIYSLAEKHGGAVCKLSQLPAMLHKLTPEHMAQITMPPKPDPMQPVANALGAFA